MSYLTQLFSTSLMPHIVCLLQPQLIWTNAISDAILALSYFLLPIALIYITRKRSDLQFSWLWPLLTLFILSTGSAHFFSILTLWIPIYPFESFLKVVAAVTALLTTVLFLRRIPAIIGFPGLEQWRKANDILKAQIKERAAAEGRIRLLNIELERRVWERTDELVGQNRKLEELLTAWDLSTGFIRQFSGKISFWSEGSVQFYGWTKEQAIGRNSHELLQTKFPKPLAEIEAELLDKDYWQGELCHRTARGYKRYAASRWVLRRDPSGKPLSVTEINTDISDRIRAAETDAHLAALVESSQDAIISQTLDGNIKSWNKGAEVLYGYPREEVIGLPFSMLLPAAERRAHAELLSRIRNGGQIDQFESKRLARSGREVTVCVIASPIFNLDGDIVGLSTISRDITEQKATLEALRLSEERQRMAVEAGNIGLWFVQFDDGKTLCNDRCKELVGLPPESAGPLLEDGLRFIHPDDRERLKEALASAIDNNQELNLEYRIIAADGALKWVHSIGNVGSTVNASGRTVRHLHGVAIDFTARKHTEDELRRTNHDLEQFAYAAAHDLQEPLRNIALALQLAEEADLSGCPPEARAMLKLAVENSRRMESMVKALLSFSRALDAQDESPIGVHGNYALLLAMQNLKTSIAESDTQITSDPLPRIGMRQFHLLQVFQNLLSNALKYQAVGRPRIHVSVRTQNTECVIAVKDNGIGIPPGCYDRVFGVFKRLRQIEAPGAGVGLALCKRIVEHYEGKIWIEPNADNGVTFAFSVPMLEEQTAIHKTSSFVN